jgi:diguanylate cyclase (GGDEF)-like protein
MYVQFPGFGAVDEGLQASGGGASSAAPRLYSIRASLFALVAACLVPAVLVSGFLVHQNYRLQREQADRDTLRMARSLAADLDRELAAVESGLRVLSTTPALAAGDLAGFHERARSALAFQPVDNYVLIDRSRQQLLNTLLPYGQPLPTGGTPPELARVFETGRAVLTDRFIGPVTGEPMIAMGVPVYRGERIAYSLNVGLSAKRIDAILRRQALPEGWIAAVLDGKGTIVARSSDPGQIVGRAAAPSFVESIRADREGVVETYTKDGNPVYAGFSRSSLSSWSVTVAEPSAHVDALLLRSIAWLVVGAAVALGLGLWVAARVSRRVTSSVTGLIEPALSLGSGQPVEFTASQLSEAEAVGKAIVQASRMFERTRHLAHHDPLTGLPNRRLFDELAASRIAQARRQGSQLALLAIDLDGFKAVNDVHGHAAGDRVLKVAADRIAGLLRESDVVARLGGDEFVVLLGDASREDAELVGAKLVDALAQPYPEVEPPVSGSVGIALCPQSGRTVGELLARADRALYGAKRAGKRRVAMDS